MDDLISRQALCEYALNQKDKSVTPNDIMRFPSAQPEAIPIAWLEEKAKWLSSLDNPFSAIEAINVRVMIKDWLEEQGQDE